MHFVIEDGKLQETFWDGSDCGKVLEIPRGVRHLASFCVDSFECEQTLPPIREVILPDSLERIDGYAFCNASEMEPLPHLHTVRFRGTLRQWCAMVKGWYEQYDAYTDFGIEEYELYLLDDQGNEYLAEHLLIPEDVKAFGGAAFAGCSSLRSVETTGDICLAPLTFALCRNLTSVIVRGEGLISENWWLFEADYWSAFDENENLVVRLPDKAADALIAEGLVETDALAVTVKLLDREETLGEIAEIASWYQEEYHYRYGTDIDGDYVRVFRIYLHNCARESGDGRGYGDSGYEDEDFPDGPEEDEDLPEGFHFDDISFARQAYSDLRSIAGQIRAYCREVRRYRRAVEKNSRKEDPLRPFVSGIDLDALADTAREIMDGIEEQQYSLEERDPLDDQEDLDGLYDQVSEMYDTIMTLMDSEYASDQSYDRLCSFGDDFDELYSKFLTDERAEDCTLEEYRQLLRADYLEAYISDLEYLLADCREADALCRNL